MVLLALAACSPAQADLSEAPTLPAPMVRVTQLPATHTPAPTLSPTPVDTASPTPEPSPTLTSTPELPDEHFIQDIDGHRQYFAIGCETSAAVDWAAYFGMPIVEFDFQYDLPLSDNPDIGFVGDVRGPWGQVPPYAYGVHAAPIAKLLVEYGVPARAVKGFTLEEVKQELAQDEPLIAWVIGNMVGGIPYEYTDKAGNSTIVAAYEHVVILTGYDADSIRYMNNGRFYEVPTEVFMNSWGVLGNMVVIYDGPAEDGDTTPADAQASQN
ncbi:MAG: hypothetical protein GYA17_17235 [Chloroflexi bacterium]|nr:hypothetical protein [Chloroflexota bacterium]